MMYIKLFFISMVLVSMVYCGAEEFSPNNTLIYGYNSEHNMYLYCHFGTEKAVETMHRSLSLPCLQRNENIRSVNSQGVTLFPYLKQGSEFGVPLKCPDLPNGTTTSGLANAQYAHNYPRSAVAACDHLIYTDCSYTCDEGFEPTTKTLRCELHGPQSNVYAQWSVPEPCSPINVGTSIADDSSDIKWYIIVFPVLGSLLLAVMLCICCKIRRNKVFKRLRGRKSPEIVDPPPLVQQGTPGGNDDTPQEPHPTTRVRAFPDGPEIVDSPPLVQQGTPGGNDDISQGFPELPFQFTNSNSNDRGNIHMNKDRLDKEIPDKVLLDALKCDSLSQVSVKWSGQTGENRLSITEPGRTDQRVFDGQDPGETCALLGNETRMGGKSPEIPDKVLLDALKCDSLSQETFPKVLFTATKCGDPLRQGQEPSETCALLDTRMAGKSPGIKCETSVKSLNSESAKLRNELRVAIEIIPDKRERIQSLVGYVETHWKRLGFSNLNEIYYIEYKNAGPQYSAADEFLKYLMAHGDTFGMLLDYFAEVGNREAMETLLKIHKDCLYCEQFRRV